MTTASPTTTATVTTTSAPPSVVSPTGNLTACDQNISAGPDTTCPFAENVFVAYAADYQANGEQSNNTVNANSPVTHQSYNMDCANDVGVQGVSECTRWIPSCARCRRGNARLSGSGGRE